MGSKKKVYEVFNMITGEWEQSDMTDEEYHALQDRINTSEDELEAEFKIISKIIEQKQGYNPDKSMD